MFGSKFFFFLNPPHSPSPFRKDNLHSFCPLCSLILFSARNKQREAQKDMANARLLIALFISFGALTAATAPVAAKCGVIQTQYQSNKCDDASYSAQDKTLVGACGSCVSMQGVYLKFICEKENQFEVTASFDDACAMPLFDFVFTKSDSCLAIPNFKYNKWVGFVDCPTTGAPQKPTTTPKPTTAKPTTAKPTTAKPTTAKPTTAKPTTAKPTTAKPTTAKPTTAKPTTAKPTTAKPTTAKPTTAKPTTAKPTTAKPTTARPTTPKPTAAKTTLAV